MQQISLLATAYNSIHSFKRNDIMDRGGLSRLSSEDMLKFMEKKHLPCKEERKILFRGEIVYDVEQDELWLRDPDYGFDLRLAGLEVEEKATFAARNQNRSPYTVFRISVDSGSCFLNCINPNSIGKEPQPRAIRKHVNVDARFEHLDEIVNFNRHESANSFAILQKSSKASSSHSTASKDARIGTISLQQQIPLDSSNATHMKLVEESCRRALYANSLRYLCFTGIICQNIFAQLDTAIISQRSIPNQVVIRVENFSTSKLDVRLLYSSKSLQLRCRFIDGVKILPGGYNDDTSATIEALIEECETPMIGNDDISSNSIDFFIRLKNLIISILAGLDDFAGFLIKSTNFNNSSTWKTFKFIAIIISIANDNQAICTKKIGKLVKNEINVDNGGGELASWSLMDNKVLLQYLT